MRRYSISILYVLFLFVHWSCESKSKSKINTKLIEYYPVTKVVDGDTFWADNNSSKGIKVRLIGVDAPESKNVFKKKIGFYGKESKAYLNTLLSGRSVKLVCDFDSLDQYGRTLAYVYLEDGTFVNSELVKNGYAMVMTVPPNVKFSDEFVKLQEQARENNTGLWSK